MKYKDTHFNSVQVAGVTFENRQTALHELKMTCPERNGLDIYLRRDPKNAYDPNAVEVWAKPRTKGRRAWKQVGFIPRENAKTVARLMDNGSKPIVDSVVIVGGYADRSIGLRLDLTFPNTSAELPPTRKQLDYIRAIINKSHGQIPAFTGTTRREATSFITRHTTNIRPRIVVHL